MRNFRRQRKLSTSNLLSQILTIASFLILLSAAPYLIFSLIKNLVAAGLMLIVFFYIFYKLVLDFWPWTSWNRVKKIMAEHRFDISIIEHSARLKVVPCSRIILKQFARRNAIYRGVEKKNGLNKVKEHDCWRWELKAVNNEAELNNRLSYHIGGKYYFCLIRSRKINP